MTFYPVDGNFPLLFFNIYTHNSCAIVYSTSTTHNNIMDCLCNKYKCICKALCSCGNGQRVLPCEAVDHPDYDFMMCGECLRKAYPKHIISTKEDIEDISEYSEEAQKEDFASFLDDIPDDELVDTEDEISEDDNEDIVEKKSWKQLNCVLKYKWGKQLAKQEVLLPEEEKQAMEWLNTVYVEYDKPEIGEAYTPKDSPTRNKSKKWLITLWDLDTNIEQLYIDSDNVVGGNGIIEAGNDGIAHFSLGIEFDVPIRLHQVGNKLNLRKGVASFTPITKENNGAWIRYNEGSGTDNKKKSGIMESYVEFGDMDQVRENSVRCSAANPGGNTGRKRGAAALQEDIQVEIKRLASQPLIDGEALSTEARYTLMLQIPGVSTRANWAKELFQRFLPNDPNPLEDLIPLPWQCTMIELMDTIYDDTFSRILPVVYDRAGKLGKTVFSHIIAKTKGEDHTQTFKTGGSRDSTMYAMKLGLRYAVFDNPRSVDPKSFPYFVSESLSDGHIQVNKYQSFTRRIRKPSQVWFVNTLPIIDKLTADRWLIFDVCNEEGTEHETDRFISEMKLCIEKIKMGVHPANLIKPYPQPINPIQQQVEWQSRHN